MKHEKSWYPGPADHDYIASIAAPVHPILAAIEVAAEPERIPILDRDAGRILAVLASDRKRIVEVGTAYGYSTLWMALSQPAGGHLVTVDPDMGRTTIARRFWREAGIIDERITVVSRPALEAFADGDPSLAGPFDLAFIDALKPEYSAYVESLVPRLAPGAMLLADNVLWSGRVAAGDGDAHTTVLRVFDETTLGDPRFRSTILPVGDGLLVASFLGGG